MLGVTVPVYNRWDMTERFLEQCWRDRADIEHLSVWDNGSTRDNYLRLHRWAEDHDGVVGGLELTIESRPDWNIHQMWNAGIQWCESLGCDVVAVLNNDIEWKPGALRQSAEHLLKRNGDLLLWDNPTHSWPTSGSVKEVHPVVRNAGPPGWGMFLLPKWRFDERYYFYGGDLDLNMTIAQAGGKVFRWFRPPARHDQHASADTSDRYKELIHHARTDDHALWVEKWGMHPNWVREEPV